MDLLESPQPARAWVARVFTAAEDVIYIGLGILLAGISFILLISASDFLLRRQSSRLRVLETIADRSP